MGRKYNKIITVRVTEDLAKALQNTNIPRGYLQDLIREEIIPQTIEKFKGAKNDNK